MPERAVPSVARDGAPALAAESLSKRYGGHGWALEDVSLTIGWGRVTALVGPNAAGKSTLIKTWVGFERPTRGIVRVAGHDPWTDRAVTTPLTAYMPQTPSLYRELSVADHIALCAHYRPTFDRSEALARVTRLAIPKDREVGRLSGGQVAQVGLAIALASHAPILLLDEPLASLDPLARREFLDMLKEGVNESGAAVLLSSHVVGDVEHAADWLVVLGVGQKLLDVSLAEAVATHRVLPAQAVTVRPEDVVGQLPGGLGWLVRSDGPPERGRPATVETVVMGYLSRGRATGDRTSATVATA